MKLTERIKNSNLFKIILGEKDQARRLLKASQEAGFSMPEIRRGLIAFYGINVSSLVDGNPTTIATLYATIKGERKNALAKELIASALKLTVAELFPTTDTAGKHEDRDAR